MNRKFSFLILLFMPLFLAQALTGFALFHLEYGWTFAPEVPSWERFLETAVFHVAAIATLTFTLGHFLAFVPGLSPNRRLALALGLMISGIVNSLSWGALKLITFSVFQFFFFAVTVVILKAALSSLQTGSSAKLQKP